MSHKAGCPAEGGYGNGVEPCICSDTRSAALIKASCEERGLDPRHAFGLLYEYASDVERDLAAANELLKQEADDTDNLLRKLGLDPERYRSEGGHLLVAKAANAANERASKAEAERDALKADAYLLDWAEKNPEAAYSAILRQWADCGRGGREKFFAFRVAIRNAKAAIDEERKL